MESIDDLIYYGMPILLLGFVAWYARRSKTLMATYRQGQDLSRSGQELVRESIRLQNESIELSREKIRIQTESNRLTRELIETLRQKH